MADKLIADARAAGLEVLAAGPRLVIRGPRAAEAIAQELLADKPAVMTTLAIEGDWDCWTEQRDGRTWHIVQRVGEHVVPWSESGASAARHSRTAAMIMSIINTTRNRKDQES